MTCSFCIVFQRCKSPWDSLCPLGPLSCLQTPSHNRSNRKPRGDYALSKAPTSYTVSTTSLYGPTHEVPTLKPHWPPISSIRLIWAQEILAARTSSERFYCNYVYLRLSKKQTGRNIQQRKGEVGQHFGLITGEVQNSVNLSTAQTWGLTRHGEHNETFLLMPSR